MKNLEKYFDNRGFIGHLDRRGELTDFGDSCQRTFTYHLLKLWTQQWISVVEQKHAIEPQVRMLNELREPTRHWYHMEWPGHCGSFSWDQFVPLFLVSLELGIQDGISIYHRVWRRWGFLWNTKDIAGKPKKTPPDFIGLLLTICFKGKHTWYLVVVALWRLLVSTVEPKNTGDDLNFSLILYFCKRHHLTRATKLACWIYRKRDPQAAWRWYFRHLEAPPMDEIAAPILKGI